MTSSRRYAEVIGDPIAHSLSPALHSHWLDILGMAGRYKATRVRRDELREYLEKRRGDPAWLGCNVTMPLKLDAIVAADQSDDLALAAGAANILLPRNGRLLAGNTDIGAIGDVLSTLAGSGAAMDRITILGSGGAARAALVALRQLRIGQVRIQARDMTQAYALAVQFRLAFEPVPFHFALEGDGVINATPLGAMGQSDLPFDPAGLSSNGWVVDYTTVPHETAFLAAARQRGLRAVGGLDLLVGQARTSFRLLFGTEAPDEIPAILSGDPG